MNKYQRCPACANVQMVAGLGGARPVNDGKAGSVSEGEAFAWYCTCVACGAKFLPTEEGAGHDLLNAEYARIQPDLPGQYRMGYWPAPGEIRLQELGPDLERLGGTTEAEH